jgi:Tfp pilus assembly protein PilP
VLKRKRRKGSKRKMLKKFPNLQITTLIILFSLQSIMITGCGSNDQKPEKKNITLKEIKIKKKEPTSTNKNEIKKTIDNETVTEYAYDATGKPDPFVPLITEIRPERKTNNKKTIAGPLTPLQKYKLEELNLVAIIKSGDKLSALFEDMDEFGYIVIEKTLIGSNGGVVKKITTDKVIIEEDAYNSSGELEKNIRSIKIQSQE